jgi:penicillin-binding protein 1A
MYFSKRTEDMSLSECALLAGLIRYPHYYSPFRHPRRTVYRRSTILARMRELRFISEHEELFTNSELVMTKRVSVPIYTAPYFVENIRLLLEPKYGSRTIYRAGWNIYTTLDVRMQRIAEKVIEKFLSSFDKIKLREVKKQIEEEKKKYEEEGYWSEITTGTPYGVGLTTDIPKVQCALLAMDPRTGQIRAMVGGRNFKKTQFNRALQARRQVGSAFKPIIYAAAIEKGYTPTTIIEDTPVVYVNDGKNWQLAAETTYYLLELDPEVLEDPEKVWVPENYKKTYLGKVLLRKALELSLNVAAVKTIEEISPVTVIDYARKFGVKSRLTKTLSLALGSSDITLFEIVRAFSVFANGGIKTRPYSVICIEDRDGKTIKENASQEEDVLSPQTSYIISNLLQGVVQNGTGRYARYLNRPCAGKTGTTNDFSDAWFIGYTPELICGVWVGYDDRRTLGEKKSGGAVACPIWTYFMREALEDTPVSDFSEPPEGITFAEVDPNTGLLATKRIPGYMEAFVDGTEPKEFAKKQRMHGVAEPDYTDVGKSFRVKYKREPVMYGPTDYGMIYEFMTTSGEEEFKAQTLGSTDYGTFYEFIDALEKEKFEAQISTSDYEMFYEPDEKNQTVP